MNLRFIKNIIFAVTLHFFLGNLGANLWASGPNEACRDFEQTLLQAIQREIQSQGLPVTQVDKVKISEILAKPSVLNYMSRHKNEFYIGGSEKEAESYNRAFIRFMEELQNKPLQFNEDRYVTFSIENSILKLMNDEIFKDKEVANAVMSHFFKKLHENIQARGSLKSQLAAVSPDLQYKDFKGYIAIFSVRDGQNKSKLIKELEEVYAKTAKEVSDEINKTDLKELFSMRTDAALHPENWFLAGFGNTPLEANVAMRKARKLLSETKGQQGIAPVHFDQHLDALFEELVEIEQARILVTTHSAFANSQMFQTLPAGKKVYSRSLIEAIRGHLSENFKSKEEALVHLKNELKDRFQIEKLSDEEYDILVGYQREVDKLSPNIYQRSRKRIKYDTNDNGITSVDFTGVGVENMEAQMQALAGVDLNLANKSQKDFLLETYRQVSKGVDEVTKRMWQAKKDFRLSIERILGPEQASLVQFSGDDGIYLPPFGSLNEKIKKQLMQALMDASKENAPSKFRLTFSESHFKNGAMVDPLKRSALNVKAEKKEKAIRKLMIKEGVSEELRKKIMIVMDYAPENFERGEFKVFIGSKQKLTPVEQSTLENVVRKSFNQASDVLNKIEFINN